MQDAQSLRRFCFTLNNWTEEEFTGIKTWATARCVYAVIGKEHVAEGTPHLQGFLHLKSPTKFSVVKNRVPRAHIEKARGSDTQNMEYCSKEDHEAWTFGQPQGQGHRTDLEAVKTAIRGGATHRQVLEDFSEECARYPAFVREYEDAVANDAVPQAELAHPYPWQQALLDRLSAPCTDDRHVIWVYDEQGGHGKTALARVLRDRLNAFYTNGGRGTDIAFAYQREPIVVFDYVREAKEFLNYGIIEALKNGILSSGKYVSVTKRFRSPHVVVFANFKPEEGKFSADRIELISI